MIQPTRVKTLNEAPENGEGRYVLYWLGLSQRTRFNPALEFAIREANRRKLPVLVCYGLAEKIPDTTARHWTFLLEGLAEIGPELEARGIGFVAHREQPVAVALRYAAEAALVVCDRNYLKPVRAFYADFAKKAPCRVIQVEGDVVVPVETASDKHEFAARTIRPKIMRLLPDYLKPLSPGKVSCRADDIVVTSDLPLDDIAKLVASLKTDHSVGPVRRFKGGSAQAHKQFRDYLNNHFADYATARGKPEAGAASHMSPYLHYGHISAIEMALQIQNSKKGDGDDKDAFLDELVVRRELAMNHVFYHPRYESLDAVPEWARKALAAHRKDKRPHTYSREQFELGKTHDVYWNAAQAEMRETGYMHNHMRMYWGKKILEWSRSPEAAWDTALTLNNKYFIDGRDANSFTNVGWLFGLHDRPWGRRPVYGTVRSMGASTLKKFDADGYCKTVERLVAAEHD